MYKKIIVYIFLAFSVLISYSQTEERAPNGPRSVRNKRDELRRRQEVWRTYSAYGDLISEIEYKNDKKEGKCIIYYAGGGEKGEKVKEEIQFFDGKKDGAYVKKYLSGQTMAEGDYSLGKRVGAWSFYYEDGQVRTEGNYEQGKKVGEWKIYNRKGILTRTINHSLAPPPPVIKKTTDGKTNKHSPIIKKTQ